MAAFADTTVDDLVILAVLCMVRCMTGSTGARVIIAGQYAGIAAILAIGLIAAADLPIVLDRRAGLLGLVPLTAVQPLPRGPQAGAQRGF